jgi:C_GCAxxG_C_C family probable redox protein
MWDAYGWENEELLWPGMVFGGGFAGEQRGTCGALTAAGICLGLRHRVPMADQEAVARAKKAAHDEAEELVEAFVARFGAVTCIGLVGTDLSGKAAFEAARASGLLDRTCHVFIPFLVRKMYEIEEKRD